MVGWRRWAQLGLIMAGLVVVYFILPVNVDYHRSTLVRGGAAVLTLALLALLVLFQLRIHIDDHSRKLDGLVVVIVLVMMVFSFTFYVVEERDPTQFEGLHTRLDALYFTMASAATVGFGDVHAEGQFARGLVLTQMVFNVVFVGTAVALLSARIKSVASDRSQARTTQRNPK